MPTMTTITTMTPSPLYMGYDRDARGGRGSTAEEDNINQQRQRQRRSLSSYSGSRSRRSSHDNSRTKRQERVGHVVRTELASLLHHGSIHCDTTATAVVAAATTATAAGGANNHNSHDPYEGGGGIGMDLRQRINVVHANVSPDLRQARVTISILSTPATATTTTTTTTPATRKANDGIARRRAYAWLVQNTKSIRYELSKRMSHMRGGAPELLFVQVDVGGAVDVMTLIDKVANSNGKYKRMELVKGEEKDGMSLDDMLRRGYEQEMMEEEDEDGWVDEEEDDDDYMEEEDNDDDDDDDTMMFMDDKEICVEKVDFDIEEVEVEETKEG